MLELLELRANRLKQVLKQLPPLLLTAVQELSESATSALQQTIAEHRCKAAADSAGAALGAGDGVEKPVRHCHNGALFVALQNTEAIPRPAAATL